MSIFKCHKVKGSGWKNSVMKRDEIKELQLGFYLSVQAEIMTSSVNCKGKSRLIPVEVLCQVSIFLSIEFMSKYYFIAAKICSGKNGFNETFIKKAKIYGKKLRI